MSLSVGSICTGYGGFELGLGLAGVDHHLSWISETGEAPSTVLSHRFPETTNLGDINHADPTAVDLITAGFPCQDISNAGHRAGITGKRSGLWWTIRDVIGNIRPSCVLLENVSAILTNGGPAVIGSLTEIGYDSRWVTVRASDAGAPHRRERWFCFAWDTQSSGRYEQADALPGTDRRPARKAGRSDSFTTYPNSDRSQPVEVFQPEKCLSAGGGQRFGKFWPAIERWGRVTGRASPRPVIDGRLNPVFVEWMMGLPEGWVTGCGLSRSAELRVLGNGIVPLQAADALKRLGV